MPTPRLLNLSVAIAARRIALQYLAAALTARRRLRDATDEDALHDFRVALRRLRSTLRAYRPWINARVVPRKLRKRLRRLARTTNAARDAEVALAWVRTQRRLSLHARPGVQRFMQELDLQRERAYAEMRERGVRSAVPAPAHRLAPAGIASAGDAAARCGGPAAAAAGRGARSRF
jgi:CHAD domain-containing protein